MITIPPFRETPISPMLCKKHRLDRGGNVTERMVLPRALRALGELREMYSCNSFKDEFRPINLEPLMTRRSSPKGEAA